MNQIMTNTIKKMHTFPEEMCISDKKTVSQDKKNCEYEKKQNQINRLKSISKAQR